jgi:hypothetical protein
VFVHVRLLVVDRLGAPLGGHVEALLEAVDGDDAPRPEQEGALDGEQPDGAAAPDGDGVARLDVAVLGGHVAGREDVAEEEHLLVVDALGNLHRPHVGVGHARVLGLPARVAAHHVRVAEDARAREAVDLLLHPRVRVRVVAGRPQPAPAEEAAPTGDRERDDHAVADFKVVHAGARLDDLAHELVTEDVAFLHRRDVAVVEVQVGAADGRRSDFDDGVARVENLRLGHVLDPHVVFAEPAKSFHLCLPDSC